jgi:hypothetical protein
VLDGEAERAVDWIQVVGPRRDLLNGDAHGDGAPWWTGGAGAVAPAFADAVDEEIVCL